MQAIVTDLLKKEETYTCSEFEKIVSIVEEKHWINSRSYLF
jgi:hypothetical protein